VVVTGARGLVGRAVAKQCAAAGDEVFAHDHESLDITNHESVRSTLERERPEAVINCAAWTDVDGCESNPQLAYAANAYAVENLAASSRRAGAVFVTISTDYVFDGTKEGFYTQRDDPNPTSIYGAAKLEGERRAQAASARTIIVRSGWIFGAGGRNFLSTVAERALRGENLKAISDAYGTPTYADDLASRLRRLAQMDLPGVYHVVNSGAGASYAEFASAALIAVGCEGVQIETVRMDALQRPAPRPRNSRLRCLLSEAVGLPALPDWKNGLNAFVAAIRARP
jgi:dTDP-4-dehydrorhamnose reductase